jgi:putative phosphoribosyl transferase
MRFASRHDVLVFALPRGGVPVAHEVATALAAPLDVLLVRKLGVPGHEELAMGAVASGGTTIVSREIMRDQGVTDEVLRGVTERALAEMQRRELLYRGDRPFPDVSGKTVILVDDGLATGASMTAAISAVRHMHPAAVIVAVPVAPQETYDELAAVADACVTVITPAPFFSVGAWYEDFRQTTDDEVRRLLAP